MKKVNKNTRAGKNGKIIVCPKCKTEVVVYHFAWCAAMCDHCKKMIQKNEYLIKE